MISAASTLTQPDEAVALYLRALSIAEDAPHLHNPDELAEPRSELAELQETESTVGSASKYR